MWRDPGNPKTALHYSIPERDVLRNRLRAAHAWMGPWVKKVESFQEFENLDIGSLANFDDLKHRLKCGNFEDYMERFEALFLGTGMLPSSVFHLKGTSGKCLTLDLYTRQLYGHECIEAFEGQIWHGSNALAKHDLQCCSGLKLWNYNYCLSWYGGQVQAIDCSYFGTSRYQDFRIVVPNEGETEAIITAPAIQEPQHCLNLGRIPKPPVLLEVSLGNFTLPKLELVSPGLFRAVADSGRCLGISKDQGLQWGSCDLAAGLEVIGESEGRKQLQVTDQCLDAAQGAEVVLYPCHPPKERIPNQVFIAEDGGPLCWPFGDADASQDSHLRCLAEGEVEQPQVVLQPCANKPAKATKAAKASYNDNDHGQVFYKRESFDGTFLLQQASGDCLGVDFENIIEANGEEAFPLSMGKCSQQWRHHDHSLILKSEDDTRWCLSANDFQHPVVASCWDEDLSQHFDTQHLPAGSVALRKPPHWADSGRERYPALCLDTTPSVREPILAVPCEEEGNLWTTHWEDVPLETQLYHQDRAPS